MTVWVFFKEVQESCLVILPLVLSTLARFSSGPLAHLEPSTNSVLLNLC